MKENFSDDGPRKLTLIDRAFQFLRPSYPPKTFTYFVSAPPFKKHGHREKELDHVLSYVLSHEIKVIDLELKTVSSGQSSGMWVFVLYRPLSKKASEKEFEMDELSLDQCAPSPDIYPLE